MSRFENRHYELLPTPTSVVPQRSHILAVDYFFFTSTFREHRGTVFFLNFTSSSYLHILLASKDISVAFSFASHCCRLTLFFYTSSFAFIRLSRSLFSTVNFRTILGPSKPLDFHSKEPIHSPFKLAIALLYPPLHLPSFPPLTT